jgi:hypothetical protein
MILILKFRTVKGVFSSVLTTGCLGPGQGLLYPLSPGWGEGGGGWAVGGGADGTARKSVSKKDNP